MLGVVAPADDGVDGAVVPVVAWVDGGGWTTGAVAGVVATVPLDPLPDELPEW